MSKIFLFRWDLRSRGGVSNYLDILTEGIKSKGIDVINIPSKNISNLSKINYLIVIIETLLNYKQMLKKYNPHIVQFNPSFDKVWLFRDIFFLLMTPKKSKIIFFRGWRNELFSKVIKISILKNLINRVINGANKVFVLSESIMNDLKNIGIDSKKLNQTTTMVITDNYLNLREFNSTKITVMFCGRLERKKGIYELLQAARLVTKINGSINFNFVGDGSQIEKLKRLKEEYNLSNNVSVLGNLRGLKKYDAYKNSDIFILPSYTEGFPNVYTEALAAGLPVIITKVGGIPEVFIDGKNGYLIEKIPPSPREIAKIILTLSSDRNLRREISRANTLEALKKYDSKVLIDKMIGHYNISI